LNPSPVDAVNLGTPGGDLSLLGLFMQADIVVKLVMLALLGASIVVWAVVFTKIAAVFGAAMGEWRRSARVAGADMTRGSVNDRIDRAMNVTISREMERMERWMVFLASVGSIAPFVGLFGTVWGIMHSFSAISAMHNTNLAVVAPGIAEALFATAIGLVAAIPAVLAYNQISTSIGRFAGRLEGFGAEFSSILSRQSEERA
jgi:biopolymer transport protein TolQ